MSDNSAADPRPLRIFLCHSKADKSAVRDLYKHLKADGLEPWLDEEDLLPGQDWQREIPKAVKNSNVVIVCLSCESVNKAGYVQKEIEFALNEAGKQPEGAIFIIPVRLKDCTVPDRLNRLQWVDLFDENGYGKLLRALRVRAESLQEIIAKPEEPVAPRPQKGETSPSNSGESNHSGSIGQTADDTLSAKPPIAPQEATAPPPAPEKQPSPPKAGQSSTKVLRKTQWILLALALGVIAVIWFVVLVFVTTVPPMPTQTLAKAPAVVSATVAISAVTPQPTLTPTPGSWVIQRDILKIFLPVLARSNKPLRLSAAQVHATETAQAKASATQAAQKTATVQACIARRVEIGSRLDRVYGPETGQLAQQPAADAITLRAAEIDEYNAVIEATFVNPYAATEGAWSYGFIFRQSGPNEAYQLIVRSDGGWRLINRVDTQAPLVIGWGNVPNLRVEATDLNTVEVLMEGGYGQLWVNDIFVTELDLKARTKPGYISIATGFYADDGPFAATTRYSNFTVWRLMPR